SFQKTSGSCQRRMRQNATTLRSAPSAPKKFGHRLTRIFTDAATEKNPHLRPLPIRAKGQGEESFLLICVSSVVIRGKIFEFKKRPAYPRSSRGLCPRCHERGRTPAIVAAARGVAQSRGEMFRNASESMFGRQVPGTP